jgi:RNA polymerase sigma factor (sigma-70 family)
MTGRTEAFAVTTQTAETLLRSVRALATGQVAGGESDRQLLEHFVNRRDEAAFAALLERHGPMVMGVCRRALRDEHLAEDVFQATFLVLARSAGTIHKQHSLSAFLHGVALRLTRKANTAAARAARDADRTPTEPPPGPAIEASWREVRQILDDELARLPERYRLPLILCYLEGRSREEAAVELGYGDGRLKGLLERGRERLRARLLHRGLAPAAVGAILLTETALAAPIPAILAITTLRTALGATQSLASCGASAPVRALVEGAAPSAGTKSLLFVLVLALVSGGVGLAMLGAPWRERAAEPPPIRLLAVDNPKVKPDDEVAVKEHILALYAPESKTRAAAAAELRWIVRKYPSGTVYLATKDGGEVAWREKVNLIEPGMTKAEVQKLLPAFAEISQGGEIASGQSHVVTYRLDYHWMVRIYYRNPDKVIERPELMKSAARIFVSPPNNFTGAWVTWHVNGQKGYEIQYTNGKYNGTFTSFHDNGAKSYEQHYVNHVTHGPDTGWFPDGRLNYTAQYKNGKQDGTWTHWYENGNKHSETNYADGKRHGRYSVWHENGQIAAFNDYKHDVKHGLEVSWDENGKLHYERRFVDGEIVESKWGP